MDLVGEAKRKISLLESSLLVIDRAEGFALQNVCYFVIFVKMVGVVDVIVNIHIKAVVALGIVGLVKDSHESSEKTIYCYNYTTFFLFLSIENYRIMVRR